MQNGVFISFYKELVKNGFPSALISSIDYLWTNLLWIVLLFLIPISLGFILFIFFYSTVDLKVLIASQIIFMILVLILTNFSVVLIIVALSLFIGILWERKTFEPEKNDFSTGYSLINSRLWLMAVFLCVGIFFIMYMNSQVYDQEIIKSNKELMMSMMPQVNDVKKQQKSEITGLTEDFKYVLTARYDSMNEDVKTQCKTLYEGMTQSLDSYRDRTIQKIDQQELGVSEEEILNNFPFFKVLDQITPVLIALSGFAFFTVFNPIIGVFGGVFYSLIKRRQKINTLSNIHGTAI